MRPRPIPSRTELFSVVLLSALACGVEAPPATEASTSAALAPLGVFELQAYIFCPTGTWCAHGSRADLEARYFAQVAEMNLHYRPTGISFQALPPIITQDDRFSGLRGGGDEELAVNGELNDDLEAELISTLGSPNRRQITMFLAPGLQKCWNGIPCPGADDGFDGDDVIFCTPPATSGVHDGYTYAHEMGHYWCLRHTFTGADPSGLGVVDMNGDDDVCDTLINVQDTPADPMTQEESDLDADGVPRNWHHWCETTVQTDVDIDSPHATRCDVTCFQQINGTTVQSGYSPLVENAMSYHDYACRGPYVRDDVRHEAFTDGQGLQMAQCRVAVPIRTQLVDVCAGRGGDTDFDGWCDVDDRCAGLATPTNTDVDGDGIGDGCDRCPTDPTSVAGNVNGDGDAWCNATDRCPSKASSTNSDTDGDGVGNACDTCPNNPDPTNLDTDGDGKGDVCDLDDDGDGCLDTADQNPKDDAVPDGVVILANCSPSSVPHLSSEAADTDGDSIRDCQDPDDDNDGVPDADDGCRTLPGSGAMCIYPGRSCPLAPIFFTCRGGGCNQQLLRISSVINPDPTTSVLLEIVSAVRGELVVAPLVSRTVLDSAQAFRAALTLPSGRRPVGALRLEVVDTRGRVISDLATYVPSTVRLGTLSGTALRVTLPSGTASLAVSGATR